jgi:hypothetical protein
MIALQVAILAAVVAVAMGCLGVMRKGGYEVGLTSD